MADDLLAEPLADHDGRIHVPKVPAWAPTMDDDKLAHYRSDC
jgi:L-alanine-DL-glutamate epimerase-like enolase superfamily enzyme